MTDQPIGFEGETPVAARGHFRIGVILAIASFLIYAGTVFSLPQVRDNSCACERSSVAAAVTNLVYGSPLGAVSSNLFKQYLKGVVDTPLKQVLRDTPGLGTAHPTSPSGGRRGRPRLLFGRADHSWRT